MDEMRGRLDNNRPRYANAILFYKSNGCTYNKATGMIDMGWNTGISIGIFENLFKDRGRIVNAKKKLAKNKLAKKRLALKVCTN